LQCTCADGGGVLIGIGAGEGERTRAHLSKLGAGSAVDTGVGGAAAIAAHRERRRTGTGGSTDVACAAKRTGRKAESGKCQRTGHREIARGDVHRCGEGHGVAGGDDHIVASNGCCAPCPGGTGTPVAGGSGGDGGGVQACACEQEDGKEQGFTSSLYSEKEAFRVLTRTRI